MRQHVDPRHTPHLDPGFDPAFGPAFEPGFRARGAGRGRRGGPPWGPGGGGRMRRGDIRTALLAVLRDGPGHGYELIQRLEEKSDGAWRPSPGSVYPTLQMLDDEGFVTATERDGKRTFELTDAGRAEAEARIDEAGAPPWELAGRGGRPSGEVREAFGHLALAIKQISSAGTDDQRERAVGVLKDARKQLYAILAED